MNAGAIAHDLLCGPANADETLSGVASVYAFDTGKTASGETANSQSFTAAHRTLPFGTNVRVTNTRNSKTVIVRINDRGPFVRGRVIDVARGAAVKLGMIGTGVARVKVTVVGGRGKLTGVCS